ncbi:MAG: glycosyltransferase family 2 protein [Paludibacteraceae bacterium]|nr:glycosyltransferase family 2 protein [Paludibacteraceae bacterium]
MPTVNPHISIVSPEYKGEKMVHELVSRIVASVEKITKNYEIILVNDASPDNTWTEIEKECKANPLVKGLDLSRNFGQHYAITAGLAYAKGDWVVVLDCDLQDIPEEIPKLYKKAQEGYDIVYAKRKIKHVSWSKRMSSVCFHTVLDWSSGTKTDPAIGNFGIYKNTVVSSINSIPQQARGLQTLLDVVGFKSSFIEVEQAPSARGGSSFTLQKLFKQAFNVILARTNKPLRFAVKLGFIMSALSFLLAVYNLIARLTGIIQLSGYTTTVFSIWFVGGLMLFVMGILGLYIGKIFDQVKGQPLYIVRESMNF